MRPVFERIARLLLALGLCAAPVACGSAPQPSVTVLIPWADGSPEYNAFSAVTNQFTVQENIKVNLEPTRASSEQLDADLAAGDPPDVVDLSSPGVLDQYKSRLQPLPVDLRGYAQPWQSLAMLGTHHVYAVPVKADVQGLLWYTAPGDKSRLQSWAGLQQLSRGETPWCLGLESPGTTSGWPGASWIADLILSKDGTTGYKAWLQGTEAWNSATVTAAWTEWGALLRQGKALYGGVKGALNNGFADLDGELAAGRCDFEHGALAATGLKNPSQAGHLPFPSPTGGTAPALVSGDFMGAFTDNPDAVRLLEYLASPRAQAQWVSSPTGYAFSANTAVSHYPGPVQQGIASLVRQADVPRCFAADDLMPAAQSTAFSQAVLEYVDNQASLGRLLAVLQKTQNAPGPSKLSAYACSG